MDIPVCIFEGEQFKHLYPLVYMHPIYDLRCGIKTIKEKIFSYFQTDKYFLHTRQYLIELVKRDNPNIPVNEIDTDICLFINGKVLPNESLIDILEKTDHDTLFVKGEYIIAARVSGLNLKKFKNSLNSVFKFSDFEGLVKKEVSVDVINYPWDLINIMAKR